MKLWLVAAIAVVGCSKDKDAAERAAPASSASPAKETSEPVVEPAPVGYDADSLGSIKFEVTGGTPEARQHFTRGLLALHSFWYQEAKKQFTQAIEADKSFRMAYWGLAMSHCKLLWGDDDLTAARAALRKMPDPDGLPPREQAWVMTAIALVGKADVRTSRQAYAQAMAALHAKYPDDETATFLAAALLASTRPGDADHVEVRHKAAALAKEVFDRNPKHPGAAHYLIHAYDTPELAEGALPAARAYAAIAPGAFHARHMPAHIFARLGMWKDAITSCESAWQASLSWSQREKLSANHHDYHSLSWLVEMNFELGRRKQADEAMTRFADAVKAGLDHRARGLYAVQVTSYLSRTGEYERVEELLAPLKAAVADDGTAPASPVQAIAPSAPAGGGAAAASCAGHPPAGAGPPHELLEQRAVISARLLAAAMQRDEPGTRKLLADKAAIETKLQPFFASVQSPEELAATDKIRPHAADAMLAHARGDDKALIAALAPIAVADDAQFSDEGAASGSLPHEEIADAYMRMGKARQALAEYELVLKKHKGRARSMLGAASAAGKLGDKAAAAAWFAQLAEQWAEADENALNQARGTAAP